MSIDDVVRNIGIISRNNGVLAGMISQTGDEARELRTLLRDTGSLARETSDQLLALQRGQHASGMPARQRTMLNKLNKDFEFVLRRFQQLAQSSASQQRKPASRRPGAMATGSHDSLQVQHRHACSEARVQNPRHSRMHHLHPRPALRSALRACSLTVCMRRPQGEEPPPAQAERKGLLDAEREEQEAARQQRQEQIQVARATQESVRERERAIQQIETTVSEVNEIFVDLGKLVSSQTEQIETISSNVENTVRQTVRAREELHHASRAKSRTRSRVCCLMLAAILAAVLFIMIMSVHRW